MFARHRWLILAAPTFLAGCGMSDVTVLEDGSGPDTETDPTMSASAENGLRATPTYDREFEAAGGDFDLPAAILNSIPSRATRYQMVQGEP